MYNDHLGDFALDDLDAAESAWTHGDATTSKSKQRPGKQAPFAPRKKGQPLDKTSPEYRKAEQDAERGLPVFKHLSWLQCQLLDKGQSSQPGHVRFRLKLEFTAADPEKCSRAGLMAMKAERWANLSSVSNFRTNLRKKKDTRVVDDSVRAVAHELIRWAEKHEEQHPGCPPSMLGFIGKRFNGRGTIVYPGQFALICYGTLDAGQTWLPVVTVTRFKGNGSGEWDEISFPMTPPPAVNRDGTPRSEAAKKFTHVGAWYSDALQERITAGKEIKAMRERDIAEREAVKAKLRQRRTA